MSIIDDRHYREEIKEILRRRDSLEPLLPYDPSLIPFDILIAVTLAYQNQRPLNTKQLLLSLPYSVTGIRYNVQRLLLDGWLKRESGTDHDQRIVRVAPGERTWRTLNPHRQ